MHMFLLKIILSIEALIQCCILKNCELYTAFITIPQDRAGV